MQIHTVLHTPLTFPISQRVLKIFYSFLVQIISIFYSGFIFNKILAARASARYVPEDSKKKTPKNDENCNF